MVAETSITRCMDCREPLRFLRGKGWVHLDGRIVKARLGLDGKLRDDHVATPNRWAAPASR